MAVFLSYWSLAAIVLFVFRYLRLVVNLISHWTFKPTAIPETPSYGPQDVTVIIPTLDGDGENLRRTVKTCLATDPFEVLIVTVEASVEAASRMATSIDSKRIRVLTVAKANKRRQMCRAIPEVQTRITIFADDDVIWPTTLIPWLLAPFEDDEEFTFGFTNETWGSYQLNADDDNFVTRWMYNHGWKIAMQYHKAAEVQTTLENGPKYLKQCLRWVRSNWRSNLTSMFVERHYWWTHPWTTYAVFQTTLTAWAFMDPLIFALIYRSTETWSPEARSQIRVLAAIWIFVFAKSIKLMGHWIRYPADLFLLPLSILFGYLHGVIKLAGLLTLSETAWGSRDGADLDDRYRMIRLPPYLSGCSEDAALKISTPLDPHDDVQRGPPPYVTASNSKAS
ncbi:hypothetical protein MBLNU457_2015t2 [Dothideomycetes sp. NU457]